MTLEYELLTTKRRRKINEQLALIDRGSPLSGDMENRIASLAYINADFASATSLLSSLLGVASLLIAIMTTEMDYGLKIIIGITALLLLLVAVLATFKFFNKDTAKQVAFTIHQQRCADLRSRTDSGLILAGIKELKNHKAIQEPNFNVARPTKDPNVKLWLSLLVVIAVTARKRNS